MAEFDHRFVHLLTSAYIFVHLLSAKTILIKKNHNHMTASHIATLSKVALRINQSTVLIITK